MRTTRLNEHNDKRQMSFLSPNGRSREIRLQKSAWGWDEKIREIRAEKEEASEKSYLLCV